MRSDTNKQSAKAFFWICFCVMFSWFTGAAAPLSAAQCPDGSDGIVAYWSLGRSSDPYIDQIDISGSQSGFCDGGSSGCPTRTAGGAIGAGQVFDGGNDGIYVPARSSFDWAAGESFTVELWVQRSSINLAGEEVLVARKDAASGMEWRFYLETGSGGVDMHAGFSMTSDVAGDNTLVVTGAKEIANNTWHHLALSYDATSGSAALFVDGQVDASQSGSFNGGFTSATANLTLGYLDDSDPRRFGGILDEVAIYSQAVPDRDLAGHYYLSRDYCLMYDSDIKLMPLGDSITMDNQTSDNNSYRKPLWNSFFADLVWVDFEGRLYSGDGEDGPRWDTDNGTYNPNPPPSYPSDPSFDIDHEGHPGITADGLADALTPLLNAAPVLDVALLHIGTNVPDGAVADISGVERILNQMRDVRPDTTVIVAKIISTQTSSDPRHTLFTQFNQLLDDEVFTRIQNGEKLILADMTSDGANLLPGDYLDTLHPNASGYAKMAAEWLNHLDSFMPRFETPLITTTALPAATRGVPYSVSVIASGRPSPDFTLNSGPTGMAIDADGLLTWTPPMDAPAQESVEISAVLAGGNSDWSNRSFTQSFMLNLNNRPTAVGETYGPIASLIDYSVSAEEGLLANDGDQDNDDLSAVLVDGPSSGTLTLEDDGSFTYRHTGSGTSDSFTYSASDGNELSEPAVVTLQIQPAFSTLEETPIAIRLEDFIYLPSGTTALSIDAGVDYTVSGTVVTPAEDFDDVLAVGIRFLAGSTQIGSFTLGINVIGINDAPEIVGQGAISTPVNTAVEIALSNLSIKDPDSLAQDFVLSITPGSNYTFTGTTITPASGFNGKLAVPIVVSDGEMDSAPFNLSITVGSGSSSGGGGGGGCFIHGVTGAVPPSKIISSRHGIVLFLSLAALILVLRADDGREI